MVCFFFDYSDDVMVVSFDGLLDIIEVWYEWGVGNESSSFEMRIEESIMVSEGVRDCNG